MLCPGVAVKLADTAHRGGPDNAGRIDVDTPDPVVRQVAVRDLPVGPVGAVELVDTAADRTYPDSTAVGIDLNGPYVVVGQVAVVGLVIGEARAVKNAQTGVGADNQVTIGLHIEVPAGIAYQALTCLVNGPVGTIELGDTAAVGGDPGDIAVEDDRADIVMRNTVAGVCLVVDGPGFLPRYRCDRDVVGLDLFVAAGWAANCQADRIDTVIGVFVGRVLSGACRSVAKVPAPTVNHTG